MVIEKLELVGYIRLQVNSIHKFVYEPESRIQLILGSNGSGKSSVMKELSPLPAVSKEFIKGGYKFIKITHNGHTYELRNSFDDSDEYSYIKDGEELNPSLTITTYKQLVKKDFNITNDVHDLLTGANRFHLMSSMERRNWFTKISSCDYTYAINYYQKIKEAHRDAQGSVKLLQSRLINEKNKVISAEQEQNLRKELDVLRKILDDFINSKPYIEKDIVTLTSHIKDVETYLEKSIFDLRKRFAKFPNSEGFLSKDEIFDTYINSETEVRTLQQKVSDLCSKIENEEKVISAYRLSNINSVGDIDNSKDEVFEQISKLASSFIFNFHFNDNKIALKALQSISDQISDIFFNIPSNEDKRFNRELIQSTLIKIDLISKNLVTLNNRQDETLSKIKELNHLKSHGPVECPKCRHNWFVGFNQQDYDALNLLNEKLAKDITTLKTEKETLDAYISEAKVFNDYFKAYVNLKLIWKKDLDAVFNYIDSNELIHLSPRKIPNLVIDIQNEINKYIVVDDLNNKIKNLDELKKTIFDKENDTLASAKSTIEKLNNELYQTNLLLNNQKLISIRLNGYTEIIDSISLLNESINAALNKRDTLFKDVETVLKRDYINTCIRETQLEIAERERQISSINIQKAIISDIETQLTEQNENQELLKLAVKKLSPTEGLIAKGLTGFINHFAMQMNNFISSIWLYPLELLPIEIKDESVDLDYKFEVRVNEKVIIPDISKTSSAMKEVIDLAFKVVSMEYLGLSNAPIFLDEFAASFDKEHRQSAYRAISNLLTNHNYSQIFMISHYEDCYGSFKNTDIIVLCDNNVPLPKDSAFNTVVKIN